ncbi:major royal jelly protein [Moniliophthora roreri MCA 2997]|uniref:Major royal jelly protein n=2 Tax=Moniliophthora roreri TaxID=221103 RepID=V2WXW2_MONRO|nr:major royal jelly protein [Moniliophthora roreri MCA 2997]
MKASKIFLQLLGISVSIAVDFAPLDTKPGLIDNGTFGPPVEVVHLFEDQPPIGITVGKSGRAFVNFNRGDLSTNPFTVGEIVNATSETPFPSLDFNTPPAGLVDSFSGMTFGSNDSSHFINVQAVVFDPKGRLWAMDTGRPVLEGGDNPPSAPGGPKLMGFDLDNEANATTPFKTITFTEDVLPALGYLNDIRFDLSPNLTASGEGIAYIADSGAHGIIVVDLGTGESWRHLDQLQQVSPVSHFLPVLFGTPTYQSSRLHPAFHWETVAGGGIDGFAISADGRFLYFTPIASRDLYRVETAPLRVNPANDPFAFIRAAQSVQFLGQMGGAADGFETDSTGLIYLSQPEHNSINTFNPETGLIELFVRDPMLAWPDTLSVADDGFLYMTVNQLWLSPVYQNGTDKRVKPFALIRVPIPGSPVRLM